MKFSRERLVFKLAAQLQRMFPITETFAFELAVMVVNRLEAEFDA